MIRGIARSLRLYPALMRVGFAEALAYRTEFVIWLLTTTMPLVMLALWVAVARDEPIGRFDSTEFVAYFLGLLLVRMLTGAWVVWELIHEIRQGTLVQRLLRPIHPILYYSAQNLSALPLRLAISLPVAIGLLVSAGGERITGDPILLSLFAFSLLGAWLINFLSMVMIASLAFFIESALGIFGVWMTVFGVFSGYLVPLELFPSWLQTISDALPFRFMISYPVALLTGRLSTAEALELFGLQWLWVLGIGLCAALAWRAGLRRFAAFGG